jgi:nucleoside-diphosphate-sugar epimerase
MNPPRVALILGVSGIVGRSLAERLLSRSDWQVVGVSRHGPSGLAGVRHLSVDLNDPAASKAVLSEAHPTHAFYATWSRQPDEPANCRVNGGMLRNALEGAAANGTVQHVALVTGLKHYLGSFDNYAAHELSTPFSEDMPRLPGDNFYYTQEDVLFESARRHNFTWSVARPHTIIGYAPGNAMNLGTSLAVYATLCRETGIAFEFPGSPQQYGGVVDMTSADLLAHHLEWEATEPAAANQAFNVVNGDVFRWKVMWKRIADYFGIEAAPYAGRAKPLVEKLASAPAEWEKIVRRYDLRASNLEAIAPWWHVDADLGRTQECMADMSRSRELGFLDYRRTWSSFKELFDRLQQERIIPKVISQPAQATSTGGAG